MSAFEARSAPSAMARATASLMAPWRGDQVGRDAEHLHLGIVGVGDEAALDHVRGAGDLREQRRDQAAGTTFGRGDALAPRAERVEEARCLIP